MIGFMKRRISILSLILLVSAYFTISTYGSAIDSEIWLDKGTYAGYGARPIVTLKDDDLNLDHKRKDEVSVTICSTTDPVGITLKLKETLSNSGEFTGDFGVAAAKSDDISKVLQIRNKDTITVKYSETNSPNANAKTYTRSAKWQASTGTVKLMKSSYTGLNSMATVSVNDKDLDLRSAYIDTAKVRIYSDADPKGITLTAYESGANTCTFAVSFGFSTNKSDTGDAILMVNPSDKIYAQYIDEIDENGAANVTTTATSTFSFSEAVVKTSATNDEGSGCMFTVTIDEPDANNPKVKDRLIAKASSGDGAREKTIWLDETGTNTGSFKGKLLLSDEMNTATTLQIKSSDIISIKYIDNTVPEGSKKEVLKSVKWTYIGTLLKTDREAYSGYKNAARITMTDYNLNTDEEKVEFVDVRVTTSDPKGITLELKETSVNSGEFTGTLYFGKSSKASAGILKVVNNETITITYTNPKDKNETVECYAKWSFLDGVISLDKKEYTGNNAPVKITVKDLDASDDVKKADDIKVTLKAGGKETKITLTETGKESGTYTGTFYINGSGDNKPSVSLNAGENFEVVYTDEFTTVGKSVDRIASAVWKGISKATLKVDKQKYVGYGSNMVIILDDPDQNKSSTERDKVLVQVRTKSGKTGTIYTLTETGNNNGEFLVVLEFTEEPYDAKKIRVAPEDTIYVDFFEKGVSTYATFVK